MIKRSRFDSKYVSFHVNIKGHITEGQFLLPQILNTEKCLHKEQTIMIMKIMVIIIIVIQDE
jgi:hypothetical protein